MKSETPDLFDFAVAPEQSAVPPVDGPVVLIDAFSQIFRAFYAIRRLTNAQGEPVNALYVFTRLLLTLERDYPSRYGALLFDRGKVEFRLKLAPDYKANRPPMPEDLKLQMPAIEAVAAAFGWPQLGAVGYEADDLIGGVSQAVSTPVQVITSDKDLSSLVDERVQLLIPAAKGGFEVRDIAAVEKKFGVTPDLIPDYLALIGDKVDNIAGVPGIGPKSAAEILNRFGPILSWCDDLSKLGDSKFAAKLMGQGELLKRNLKLVSLRCDLPEELTPVAAHLTRQAPDWEKIREICQYNGFKTLLKELPGAAVEADLF